jgi:hypothetical protein
VVDDVGRKDLADLLLQTSFLPLALFMGLLYWLLYKAVPNLCQRR